MAALICLASAGVLEVGHHLLAGEPVGSEAAEVLHEPGLFVARQDALAHQADLAEVGHQAAEHRLAELVQPTRHYLASLFHATATLAYLFEARIHVLEAIDTLHEVRVINQPGRVLPPHCSSLGKAITAFQERSAADEILAVYGLVRRTPPPWTHTFGIALLLWPVGPLLGIVTLGKMVS